MLFKKNILKGTNKKVLVEVSARHCHLSQTDLEKLFGQGYQLKKFKQLSQPSDFAAEEKVSIAFGTKKIENIRVVGPVRIQTQVEISMTDAAGSGIIPPMRLSGDLHGTAAVTLYGPAGKAELVEGLIIAKRHLHCSTDEAKELKIKTGDIISVAAGEERAVTFEKVIVRAKDGYALCLQLDTDEGNAAGINKTGGGKIL